MRRHSLCEALLPLIFFSFSGMTNATEYLAYEADYSGRTIEDLVYQVDGLEDWYIETGSASSALPSGGGVMRIMPWANNTPLKYAFPSLDGGAIDMDFVLLSGGNESYKSTASIFSGVSAEALGEAKYNVCTADINLDQLDDYIFLPRPPQVDARIYLTPSSGQNAPLISYNPYFVDLSGDGIVDLFLQSLTDGASSYYLEGQEGGCFSVKQVLTEIEAQKIDAENAEITLQFSPSGEKAGLTVNGESRIITNSYGEFSGAESVIDIEPEYQEDRLVGELPYQLSVSPGGDALISVAVAVPPLPTGFSPNVSLVYGSSNGSGHIGNGWSVGGLSSIHRCPTSMIFDGVIDAVDFDDNDAYCLDGVRLIQVGESTNSDFVEYRTSRNDFSRIIYDTSNNSFVRLERDGKVSFFGASADSKWEASGRQDVAIWAISSKEDRYGNSYEFSYIEDSSEGERFISRIDFGNSGGGFRHHIDFSYDLTRPDKSRRFLAGTKVTISQRLNTISVYSDGQLYRAYDLNYDAVIGSDGHSRLAKLEERVSSGKSREINFSWTEDALPGFTEVPTNISVTSSDASKVRVIDVNRDGRQDFVVPINGQWNVVYGALNGLDGPHLCAGQPPTIYPDRTFVIDFDGDGYQELLDGETWTLLVPDESCAITQVQISQPSQDTVYSHNFLDVNGDGLTDYVSSSETIYLNDFPNYGFVEASSYENIWAIYPVDTNTDGRMDYVSVYVKNDQLRTDILLSEGDTLIRQGVDSFTIGYQLNYRPRVMDMNGDGVMDIAIPLQYDYYTGSMRWRYILNKGDGDFSFNDGAAAMPWTSMEQVPDVSKNFVVDYNGDGRDDIIGRKGYVTAGVSVLVSTDNGDGTYSFSPQTVPGLSSNDIRVSLDYDGDGDRDFLSYLSGSWRILRHDRVAPRKVTAITNAAGTSAIHYQPLAESRYGIGGRKHVVNQLEQPDGVGGVYQTNYEFSGYNYDRQYRQELGFETVVIEEPRLGYRKETSYSLSAAYGSSPTEVVEYVNDVVTERTKVDSYAYLDSGSVRFRYPAQSTSTSYDYDTGDILKTAVTETIYSDSTVGSFGDYLGQVSSQTTTTQGDDGVYITHSEYPEYLSEVQAVSGVSDFSTGASRASLWRSSLKRQIRTSTVPNRELSSGSLSNQRITDYEYYGDGGLQKTTLDVGTPNEIITEYHYSVSTGALGLPSSKVVSTENGNAFLARTTSYTYVLDANGGMDITSQNAQGHVTSERLAPVTGLKEYAIDANQVRIDYSYDELGRVAGSSKLISSADQALERGYCQSIGGNAGWDSALCEPGEYMYSKVTSDASIYPIYSFLDSLGRVVRKASPAVNGQYVKQKTVYNSKGRVEKVSLPYVGASAAHWTQFEHDDIGRVTRITNPDATFMTTEYAGLTTVMTAENGHTHTEVRNVLGQLVRTVDANGSAIDYAYSAQGKLRYTRDSAGNPIHIEYDLAGNRSALYDLDLTPMASFQGRKGGLYFTYDALGQQITETDGQNRVTCYVYDQLGRTTKRIEQYTGSAEDALNSCTNDVGTNRTTVFQYDTAPGKGVGGLAAVVGPNDYAEQYTYYDNGIDDARVQSVSTTLSADESYSSSYTYDVMGRPDTFTYPGGQLTSKYRYNDVGYLVAVEDANDNTQYWRADETRVTAFGEFGKEYLGNGVAITKSFNAETGALEAIEAAKGSQKFLDWHYAYDDVGNLKSKTDAARGQTEVFSYDALNRVTSVTLNGAEEQALEYDPAGLGNISVKSDVGSYLYGGNTPEGYEKQCGRVVPGPHAVTSVDADGERAIYCYDKSGNMVRRGDTHISYSSFGKPETIRKGSTSVEFAYGPRRNRIKRLDVMEKGKASERTLATTYIQGVVEKIQDGSSIAYRHYVAGKAVVTTNNGERTTNYLLTDYQGTVNAILNQDASQVSYQDYDIWGKSRLSNKATNKGAQSTGSLSERKGYTGHENIESIDLIHMNGRVFDPKLARFLSADPYIQAPSYSQSFNRYSYTWNNPINLVDPSGYEAGVPRLETNVIALDENPQVDFGPIPWQSTPAPTYYNSVDIAQSIDRGSFAGGTIPVATSPAPAENAPVGNGGVVDLSTAPAREPFSGNLVETSLPGLGETYLDSNFSELVGTFIAGASEAGVNLHFNSAYRSPEYQQGLHEDPTAITPATRSLHSAGLAVDINFSSLSDIPGGLSGDRQRQIILEAASSAGLSWGGNFQNPDPPHFFYDPGLDRILLINNATRSLGND